MCVRFWQQIAGQNQNLRSQFVKLEIKYLQLKTSSRKIISNQVFVLRNSFLQPINSGVDVLKTILSNVSMMIPFLSLQHLHAALSNSHYVNVVLIIVTDFIPYASLI